MGLKTPCDNDVFFTLPHGDTLQTPFDASFPPPASPLEMDTVSPSTRSHLAGPQGGPACLAVLLLLPVMGMHQASHHCLQKAFDLLMHSTTCLWGRKYGIMTHGISSFLARLFFFCKNYPSFFPPCQPLSLLVGINGFLADPTNRIRFVYTTKHSSWLNQVEIWFSILTRRLLARSSCFSVEQLQQRILDFIAHYNSTSRRAFRWTYKGPPKSS